MDITEEELHRLQSSFNALQDHIDQHPTYFYEALFRHAPEFRELFRDDIESQGMRFIRTLGIIVAKLRDEDAIRDRYSDLGAKHASIGIVESQFAPMEEALIDTMRMALGEDLTPELEALWRRAYNQISAAMIQRGQIPHD